MKCDAPPWTLGNLLTLRHNKIGKWKSASWIYNQFQIDSVFKYFAHRHHNEEVRTIYSILRLYNIDAIWSSTRNLFYRWYCWQVTTKSWASVRLILYVICVSFSFLLEMTWNKMKKARRKITTHDSKVFEIYFWAGVAPAPIIDIQKASHCQRNYLLLFFCRK